MRPTLTSFKIRKLQLFQPLTLLCIFLSITDLLRLYNLVYDL